MLHRDIKPDNFLLGQNKNRHVVYLIDFGLSKRFRNPRTGEHIEYIDGKSFTGTARYASIYTHLGIEQGRRDDLESLGYNLLYFLRGSLPWQGIKVKSNKEKYKRILDIKMNLSSRKLCENYPQEFCIFIEYSRSLHFEQKPDYDYIKGLFSRVFLRFQFEKDFIYKWNTFMISYDSKEERKENEKRLNGIESIEV